jgi:hypothetical protein
MERVLTDINISNEKYIYNEKYSIMLNKLFICNNYKNSPSDVHEKNHFINFCNNICYGPYC